MNLLELLPQLLPFYVEPCLVKTLRSILLSRDSSLHVISALRLRQVEVKRKVISLQYLNCSSGRGCYSINRQPRSVSLIHVRGSIRITHVFFLMVYVRNMEVTKVCTLMCRNTPFNIHKC